MCFKKNTCCNPPTGRVCLQSSFGLLGLASQASCVYLPRMATHTATGEASRVYTISHSKYRLVAKKTLLFKHPGVFV